MEQVNQHEHEHFVIHVSGRRVDFEIEKPTARQILDKAGFTGTFCLAATHGEGGKVVKNFGDDEVVDLKEYKHFRATFCGPEVVS